MTDTYELTRLTMLCGHKPEQKLVSMLVTALGGARPSQDEDIDCNLYIEGTTARHGDTVRCTLMLCDMEDHIVLTAVRQDYAAALANEVIAQDIADRLWARLI